MSSTTERSVGTPFRPREASATSPLSPELAQRLTDFTTTLHELTEGRASIPLPEDPDCEHYDDLSVSAFFTELPASVKGLITAIGGGIMTDAEVSITHQVSIRHNAYNGEHHVFVVSFPPGDPRTAASIQLEPNLAILKRQKIVFSEDAAERTIWNPQAVLKRLEVKRADRTYIARDFITGEFLENREERQTQIGVGAILRQSNEEQLKLFEDLASLVAENRDEIAA